MKKYSACALALLLLLSLCAPLAAAVSSAKRVPCGSQRSCSTFSASTSA